jgi:hypothetical protein
MRKIRSWMFITLDGVVESPEKWVRFNDELGQAIDAEMLMPVLAGSGAQFPRGDHEVALELADSSSFGNGVTSLTYGPAQA